MLVLVSVHLSIIIITTIVIIIIEVMIGHAPSPSAPPAVGSGGAALSEISGPFSAADVAANCSGGAMKEPMLWVISYTLMAVCALVLVALLLLLVLPCRRRDHGGEITDESSLVRHRIK